MRTYKKFDGKKVIKIASKVSPLGNCIPLAIKNDTGEVIYSSDKYIHVILDKLGARYRAYTVNDYKLRRKFCDSALGMHMIDDHKFTKNALDRIGNWIENYVHKIPYDETKKRRNKLACLR